MRYRTNHSKLNKMLMLIAVLAMTLLLCGCRTRISNNTEVASTITDDEGWMQELYQSRRDELGIPVAKKPFFTGTKEEDIEGYDDDYDIDTDNLDDYEDDPWDEEFADDDDDESSSGSSSSSGTTVAPKRKTSSTTVKRKTSTTTPKRRISTTTTKKKTTNTPTETTKKQYTITLDGDGVDMGGATITVEEGSTYQGLPTPSRDDYTFGGWFTKKEGKGTRVEDGDKFAEKADQTLYAYWIEKDPLEVWGNRFDVAANNISDDKLNCYVVGSDKAEGIVDACKGVSVEADKNPTYLIVFAKNDDIVDRSAEDAYIKYHDGNPEEGIEPISSLTNAIVISDDSIYGNDKTKLMHKITLLSQLYGSFSDEDLSKALMDLGLEPCYMDIYPPANP